MGQQVEIDGRRLDGLRRDLGLTQKELAETVGVTKYTVSRWCRDGVHRLRWGNIRNLADALKVTSDELMDTIAKQNNDRTHDELDEMEAEWLQIFRQLTPLMKARARVALEEFIQSHSSAK